MTGLLLTTEQQRAWWSHQVSAGDDVAAVAWRFAAAPVTLVAALQALWQRCPALRLAVVEVDGQPVAQVHPASLPVVVEESVAVVPEEREHWLRQRTLAVARGAVDPEREPLLRVLAIRFTDPAGTTEDHGLILSLHRLLGDGAALAQVVRAALTGGMLDGAMDAQVQAEAQAWWDRRLTGVGPASEYPAEKVRTGNDGFIPVEAWIPRAGITVAEAMAAVAVVLHRSGDAEELVLGAMPSQDPAAAQLGHGPLLPLRLTLTNDEPLGTLRQRIATDLAEAQAHALPTATLIERHAPVTDAGRASLVQVLVTSAPTPAIGQVPLIRCHPSDHLDLLLAVEDDGLRLVANGARFAAERIRRLAGHLGQVLAAAAEQTVAGVGLLTPAEIAEQAAWNATEVVWPAHRSLHGLVEAQVARTPDAEAVVFAGRSLSYRQLDRAANHLAQRLAGLGVGRGTIVGICAERSLELVVALLAVIKAGGAYLPLDPELPAERLAGMVADAATPLVLAQPAVRERLAGSNVRVEDLLPPAADTELPAELASPAAGREIGHDDVAYVIFTSGSTGRPKGAPNTHGGICNRLLWMQAQYGLTAADRVLQKTTYAFDVSVWEFFWPLLTGACLVVAAPGLHKDAAGLAQVIAAERITTIHFVPSMLQVFLEEADPAACGSLRRIIASGEALPFELAERCLTRLPGSGLHNLYGPTEAAVDVTHWTCRSGEPSRTVPIGRPVANTRIHLLDRCGQPVPVGVPGELIIAGVQVALGYCNRPELTAERFPADRFAGHGRWYRTGDLARWGDDGAIEYLGRLDFQVKLRGLRIELGEIESALTSHPTVREAVVTLFTHGGDQHLAAYVTSSAGQRVDVDALKAHLAHRLPSYMVPWVVLVLDAMPLSANGKVDRKRLPNPVPPVAASAGRAPDSVHERAVAAAWCAVLGRASVGADDSFFALGGTSLRLTRVLALLRGTLAPAVAAGLRIAHLFQHPTVAGLAAHLDRLVQHGATTPASPRVPVTAAAAGREPIAIVGAALRVPGATSLEAFWEILREGRETISVIPAEEIEGRDAGVNEPGYVRARGLLPDLDLVDAGFLGMTPREAEITDPQYRQFLELCWEALEHAAIDPFRYPGEIGIYAGMSMPTYLLSNLGTRELLDEFTGAYQIGHYPYLISNDKDFLATRVAHRFNLRGPAMSVGAACATSLVAVSQAVATLQAGLADAMLAGSVSITTPQKRGYLHQEGTMGSADGHCKPFDASATGTVFASGMAVVVLKRLSDAQAAGDRILAVIRGVGLNNDGAAPDKASYLAPSVTRQADCIARAHAAAGISADTIGLVEAHGTATPLGDPVEVEGLTRAFRATTDRTGFCWLGSIKGNMGHADSASGVIGLIKTALCLHHRAIVPLVHFQAPNPHVDWAGSPFRIADRLMPWDVPADQAHPRRAGVSSFGVGGTNAHVVLEEAPAPTLAAPPARPVQLLTLSARSGPALEAAAARLADHLAQRPEAGLDHLADTAWTLQTGRRGFPVRRSLLVDSQAQAIAALRVLGQDSVTATDQRVAFLFPGQGAQRARMGEALYRQEPVFRASFDRLAEAVRPVLGEDLRELVFSDDGGRLARTAITQPALFALEYALADQLAAWGVVPGAMIGHSLGEYVAAARAGVFTAEDAIRLVARRGALIQALPPGAMIAVRLPEDEALPWCRAWAGGSIDLVAVNAPGSSVLAGPLDAIAELEAALIATGLKPKRLDTSHAFHSAMLEPVVGPFAELVAAARPQPPQSRFISCVSGDWITAAQATDPLYWARHLRQPVRFAAGLATLARSFRVACEVGPGRALAALAGQADEPLPAVVGALVEGDGPAALLGAVGHLWEAGVEPDWSAIHGGPRRSVALPAYPFERTRHWIDAPPRAGTVAVAVTSAAAPVPVAPSPAAARTPAAVEDLLLGMIATQSGFPRESLKADATFPDLGLSSLILTETAAAISRRFKVSIPLRRFFRDLTTVRAVAAWICAQQGPVVEVPAAHAASSTNGPPLATGPAGVRPARWRIDAWHAGAHLPGAGDRMCRLELSGEFVAERWRQALQVLARRHPLLTAAIGSDGMLRPEAGRAPELKQSRVAPAKLERTIGESQVAPWTAGDAPLRVRAVEAGSRTVVVVRLHALVGDDWSLSVILHDLAVALGQAPAEDLSPLDPAPLLVPEPLAPERAQAWRELADRLITIPQADAGTGGQQVAGEGLDPQLVERLAGLARTSGTTLASVFLAGFQCCLRQVLDQPRIALGLHLAARAPAQVRAVGPFARLVPIIAELPGERTLAEVIAAAQDGLLDALEHQAEDWSGLDLDEVQREALRPVATLAVNQGAFRDLGLGAGVVPMWLPARSGGESVAIELVEHDGHWQAWCRLAATLGDEAAAARWLAAFSEALERLVEAPASTLTDLQLPAVVQAPALTLHHTAPGREGMTVEEWRTTPLIARLQPKGSRPPFVFIGDYYDVARHLGDDQPFLALEVPSSIRKVPERPSFAEIAERAVRELRAEQPRGPYFLGGHCFGAMVIHAIANRLQAEGDEVALLVLMDPPPPPGVDTGTVRRNSLGNILGYHARTLSRMVVKERGRGVAGYLTEKTRNLITLTRDRMKDVQAQALTDLYTGFEPKLFHGTITVVIARDVCLTVLPGQEGTAEDPRLLWAPFASQGLSRIVAAGNHVSFLKGANVAAFGAQLRTAIDGALAKPAAAQAAKG